MIRMIRTTKLRALREGAELASVLEADLENAEAATEAYEKDLDAQAGLRRQLVTEVRGLRVELVAAESRNTDFARLTNLLLGAVKYAVDAAEAPLDVVLHEGRLHSAHRDRQAAEADTPFSDGTWVAAPDPDPNPLGWRIQRATPPQLPAPGSAGEIEALLERLERPAMEQLAEADRLQELARQLETFRSQRDTAIEDTETAVTALTAESLAYALHRAAVAEVASEIAMVLSTADPRALLCEVSGLLLRHAELLGIDPHGSGDGAARNETKGAAA